MSLPPARLAIDASATTRAGALSAWLFIDGAAYTGASGAATGSGLPK